MTKIDNALPTRGTLFRRGMHIDPSCPLCGDNIKTIDHLFWECSMIKRVWSLAYQHRWVPLPPSQDDQLSSNQLVMAHHHSNNPKDILKVAFLL